MLRPSRAGVIHLSLVVVAAALVVRSAYVQLWQGSVWTAHAAREHAAAAPPALFRGPILDASGTPLVLSRDLVQLSVAPDQVKDRQAVARALARAGVGPTWVRKATDTHRTWVTLPSRVLPGDAASALALHGVYAAPIAERVGLATEGITAITGHVGPDGAGTDGIEAALDSVLRGDTTRTVVLRDALGRALESPSARIATTGGGDAVVLTLNRALQEICERALDDAVTRMDATGGDIVVLEPHDGDILAVASQRRGVVGGVSTALTEPYEPGSTIKPFIAAALLSRGRVAPRDVVDTHTGRLEIHGRTLVDSHMAPSMTLRDVIRLSSNVGIAQFAQRLSPREEYEALRDVGFGSPSGLPFPAEAAGTLREPLHWSKQSPASLAIGYEVSVTPLQLALAYGSIANGGELLEPGLVREIRSADGTVRYRRARRVVRRVMAPEVAQQLRDILVETVAHGTAGEADLPSYIVAGKTGTARRTDYGAGYGRNEYTASFVGLFPGRNPQYVILVKLDDPTSSYYGGKTAAPVFKTILQAALAARDASLDRGALAVSRRGTTAADAPLLSSADTLSAPESSPGDVSPQSAVTVPIGALPAPKQPTPATPVTVPDVRGWTARAAVHALHRAGLEVQLMPGAQGVTDPVAGAAVRWGTVVRLGDGT